MDRSWNFSPFYFVRWSLARWRAGYELGLRLRASILELAHIACFGNCFGAPEIQE
jgi:hypothetical protein